MIISLATSGFEELARDLARSPQSVKNQARGTAAKRLDAAAQAARRRAVAQWSTYGRGMRGSAGTIRARMSRANEPVGYLLANGAGVFMSEHGSGHNAPQPVLGEAVRGQLDGWVSDLRGIGVGL